MQITRAQPSAATAAFASEVGHQDPVAVEGGRTHWQHGGPLAAHARLLRAPSGVVSFEPQEMIVRCGAGTTVAEVADVLAAKAQMCTLDPGDPHRSTVGGVLAAGVSGHRRLRHGPVRDLLLEAQYVAADGTIIRAGAPVVKNVSGFDLNKLLVGSFGSLGLLAEVVLRCRPAPAVSGWFRLEGADPWRVRACVHDPSSILWDGALVWVLVEGDAGDVAAASHSLAACKAIAVHPSGRCPGVRGRRRTHRRTGSVGGRDRGGYGPCDTHTATGRVAQRCVAGSTEARVRPYRSAVPWTFPVVTKRTGGPLRLDEDLLVACVSCGLCLPHCPTYRATGEETASPRGRISLMRAIELDGLAVDAAAVGFLERCVMCRACETACPSGVQFGRLMEDTRSSLADQGRTAPRWLRLALDRLPHHRLLLAGSSVLGVAQRLRLVPASLAARLGLPPRIAIRRERLVPRATGADDADAWLFTGCVMDAWQRDVHASALRVMQATGARVALPGAGGGCCGALHVHAGLTDRARTLAAGVMDAFPGDAPIVVDSAGCGAALQDYGHLIGTERAQMFSARVIDVCAWLAERIDQLPTVSPEQRFEERVAVQDPCHLRHVQRAHMPVRTVLGRYADLVELDDEGRCCGAGGAYSIMQPRLAGTIRTEKVAAIGRTGVRVVASGNPGCSMWLGGAGLDVRHPVTIIDEVLRGAGNGAG